MKVGGTKVRIGGMAKGSGMIHPNMATMLGVCVCYHYILLKNAVAYMNNLTMNNGGLWFLCKRS